MSPVFVSFYTDRYAGEAEALYASAQAAGLETDIQSVPDLGWWELNCGRKPAFIREMIGKYPGRPVVWLDADARIRQQPTLFDSLLCDFAAHWRYGVELLSGTMFFGATAKAMTLVEAWCDVQRQSPREWDQKTLQRTIEMDAVAGLSVEHLPPSYTAIFDARMCDVPVIEHMQASRRLKREIFHHAV